ncbi:MAG: TIM barrel protein [Chloroflexota bacterium]
MTDSPRPRLSTSTWSLHRALGLTYPDSPAQPNTGSAQTYGSGNITLLDVPAKLAAAGIHTLEICHFHFPSRDPGYIGELRAALKAADVEVFSLLIDDGDIAHPTDSQRDLEWISGWIETAALLGAHCTRVVAGKTSPSEEALERSIKGLKTLVERGKANNVRVMTENWLNLLATPDYVRRVMEAVDIGLCADFGNWRGATKYEDLAVIMPYAESCHAKCSFSAAGEPDRDDYVRCLELSQAAGFSGPYTLIYDSASVDEWNGLAVEASMVQPYLN